MFGTGTARNPAWTPQPWQKDPDMKLVMAAALAALLASGAAQAQTPGSAMGDESLPSCSHAVTDHCTQRGEAMTPSPRMHHHAAIHHHHRKMAMNGHKHHTRHRHAVKHAVAKKHAMATAKPKG